jgi:hypothetical protein
MVGIMLDGEDRTDLIQQLSERQQEVANTAGIIGIVLWKVS